jgi:hypothetical protein
MLQNAKFDGLPVNPALYALESDATVYSRPSTSSCPRAPPPCAAPATDYNLLTAA